MIAARLRVPNPSIAVRRDRRIITPGKSLTSLRKARTRFPVMLHYCLIVAFLWRGPTICILTVEQIIKRRFQYL